MTATLFLAVALGRTAFDTVKLNLPSGTKLTYSSTVKAVADAMGQTFNTTTTAKQVYEVTGIEDGWMRIKQTTTEYKLDSDSPFAASLPDVRGMAISSLVGPTRKVKDWKIAERGGLTQEQAEVMAGGAAAEMEIGLDGLMFPEGDLAKGTKWELVHSPSGTGMGGMKAVTTGKVKTAYEVLDVTGSGKDQVAVITARTQGSYKMEITTPDGGTFALDVKIDNTQKYTVRTSDGVVTKMQSAGTQTMGSDFGEFTSKSESTTELAKA